jgi:hypothetical protein
VETGQVSREPVFVRLLDTMRKLSLETSSVADMAERVVDHTVGPNGKGGPGVGPTTDKAAEFSVTDQFDRLIEYTFRSVQRIEGHLNRLAAELPNSPASPTPSTRGPF